MRRPLIVANWKMNGTFASATSLLEDLRREASSTSVDVVVCPSFVYLPLCRDVLSGTPIAWGAQNVSEQAAGAYTGEVSVDMLAELACRYVIVGHSERRALYNETDDLVIAKARQVLSGGLTPIICVGETLAEREAGQTNAVIARQINAVLAGFEAKDLSGLVLAYEPVWAIGTGQTATPEQAQAVHAFIRGLWSAHPAGVDSAPSLRVLYGGSVKADNACPIFAQPDVDGGLVGGASLDAGQFNAIIRAANKA
jgi:triosephosphate isomerase